MLDVAEQAVVLERLGFTPSPEQAAILNDTSLVRLIAGGERAGKSNLAGAALAAQAMDGKLFWIAGPDYVQTHAEFDYALEYLSRLGAVAGSPAKPRDGAWEMRLKGGTIIRTKTTEDPSKLASEAPDGILMVEAGQQSFEVFRKLFARTAEARARGAGWLMAVGTFEKAKRWYSELWTEMRGDANKWGGKSFSLPTWSNRVIFPLGRQDPAIIAMTAALPPEYVLERFGGEPAANEGAVFSAEFRSTEHVVPITFGNVDSATRGMDGWILPANAPLEVWIDPGYAGAYAVEFACIQGGLVFIVDEVYARGLTGEEVILRARAKRDLWERVRDGVIDIAGKQHHAMESQWELWSRIAGLNLAMQPVPILDGIMRHRTFLRDPFTKTPRLFHDPKCIGAIEEYDAYRYPEVKQSRSESELPLDRDNHAMKAIAYGLVRRFGFVDGQRPREMRRRLETEVEREIREALREREAAFRTNGDQPGWYE